MHPLQGRAGARGKGLRVESAPSAIDVVEAAFVAAAREVALLPAAVAPEVAFAGRSNVGKSSLMNALMGRRNLVRTSSTPGCTRQIALFQARARDGGLFMLVDLPGFGYARRSKDERARWADLCDRYLLERFALAAVVLLVDARRGLQDEERQLSEFLAAREPRPRLLVVATKIDKVPSSQRRAALMRMQADIAVSAVSGEGVGELWRAIRRAVS